MKKIIPALTIVLLSCTQNKVDTKSEGDKVMQVSRQWSEASSAQDVEKTLSYWADSAIVVAPGQPVLKGKQQIRQMVEGSFKTPGFKISWEPQSAEVSEGGDMAYLIEKSQITVNDSTGKPITQHLRGVTIWKKQADGSWKNVVDISTPEP